MSRPRSAAEIFLVMLVNGAISLVVFAGTLLRETPEFWRNAGGYPVSLRNLVYLAYYPLLLLIFSGSIMGSLLALRFLARHKGIGSGLLVLSILQWVLLLIILVIMLWNNVDNWVNGRPLHFHSPE